MKIHNQDFLKQLRITLGGESLTWLHDFIAADGLSIILELLGDLEQNLANRSNNQAVSPNDPQVQAVAELIRCLSCLTNNKVIAKSQLENFFSRPQKRFIPFSFLGK